MLSVGYVDFILCSFIIFPYEMQQINEIIEFSAYLSSLYCLINFLSNQT